MIRLCDISIGYKGKVVRENLSHHFAASTFTALVGRNGTGKSTLLRTIAGLQLLTSGDILYDGHSLNEYTLTQLAAKRAVVLTHQERPALTVQEVVAMGRARFTGMTGRLSADDSAAVAEAIAEVGLTDYAETIVSTLSDGYAQRVMIASALAQQTPVILLDEPAAFLDYPSRCELYALLAQLAEKGKCIVCATHDLDLIDRYTTLRLEL